MPSHRRARQLDRGEEIRRQRRRPIRRRQRAKILARRAAGIGHQNVGVGTGGEHRLATLLGGDIGGRHARRRGALLGDARGRRGERVAIARYQRDGDALLRQRRRAGEAEPARGAANQRLATGDSEIHPLSSRR
jgi:hypothetical protein